MIRTISPVHISLQHCDVLRKWLGFAQCDETINVLSLIKNKGVFETRPPRPGYSFIWDTNIVLEYLRKIWPIKDMPLSDVTLKLAMLLAFSTAQRAQTLRSINVENIQN